MTKIYRPYNNIVNNLYQRDICYNNFFSTPSATFNQIVKSFLGLSDSFYKTDLYYHSGCVNSIEFSVDGQFMVSDDRPLNPIPSGPAILNLGSEDSNNQHSILNEDIMVLNYFDNHIRHSFCDDDNLEEFIDLWDNELMDKFEVVDPQFDRDLRYIKSLIIDFKENDKKKEFAIKQIEQEKLKDSKHKSKIVSIRNISYLFNNKKIKQSKIILRRAYKLIQNRLRFIRKLKKEEDKNDENWLENVQRLVDIEPQLKEMLIDLNKMYKEKRELESISSSHYCNLLKRLDRLFFTRSIRFLPFLNDGSSISTLSSTDIEQNEQEENVHLESTSNSESESNNEEISSSINSSKTDQKSEQSKNKNEESDEYSSNSSKSAETFNFSDDSLSAGSLLDDETQSDKTKNSANKKKNLKRKKSNKTTNSMFQQESNDFNRVSNNLFNFNFSSSDSDSSDDDKPFRRFKRSKRIDKTKKYNNFAFDSDLDASSSSISTENQADSQASSSKAKKSSSVLESTEKVDDFLKGLERDTKKLFNKNKRVKKSNEYFNENDLSRSPDDASYNFNHSISDNLDRNLNELNNSNETKDNLTKLNKITKESSEKSKFS